jgi:hypothetical protein
MMKPQPVEDLGARGRKEADMLQGQVPYLGPWEEVKPALFAKPTQLTAILSTWHFGSQGPLPRAS